MCVCVCSEYERAPENAMKPTISNRQQYYVWIAGMNHSRIVISMVDSLIMHVECYVNMNIDFKPIMINLFYVKWYHWKLLTLVAFARHRGSWREWNNLCEKNERMKEILENHASCRCVSFISSCARKNTKKV